MQALSKYRASSVQPMPSGLTVTLSREMCVTKQWRASSLQKVMCPIIVIDCHFLTKLPVIR